VIVQDVDELWGVTPAMLDSYDAGGFTAVRGNGYHMVSPEDTRDLSTLFEGIRDAKFYDKTGLFKPSAIQDITFGTGGHYAHPSGNVAVVDGSSADRAPQPIMYHLKYFSLEFKLERTRAIGPRVAKVNKQRQAGAQYWSSQIGHWAPEFQKARASRAPVPGLSATQRLFMPGAAEGAGLM
jgi:hypothetical protein